MLYLHIPFCQSRCIYCDFFSTTRGAAEKEAFVDALCEEIRERKEYLAENTLKTIYFGGGTPSRLNFRQLCRIMECIREQFEILPDAELTFEANPDDVTVEFAAQLRSLGFNRVSLGVQTFDGLLLRKLNRRHTAEEARNAVKILTESGIVNISIDLIYGLPGQTLRMFKRDLEDAFSLPVKHLSAYSLMVEEGTPLSRMVAGGQVLPADEELCLQEYELLMDKAREKGFEHYEISNFALPGFYSRHNSAYWNAIPYLGCGPGAHSYNGQSRWRNLPNLDAYLKSPGKPPHEVETLSKDEMFDELVFTSLRTSKGLKLSEVREKYGEKCLEEMLAAASCHISGGRLSLNAGFLRLTRKGLFVSDDVMSDLMRA